MASCIICFKDNGNTKKICDAIAARANYKLIHITGNESFDLSGYDRVIVGTGVYGSMPHTNLVSFIRGLKAEHKPNTIHVLLTWLGRGKSDLSVFKKIQNECSLKGIAVSPEYKKSLGHSFCIIHIGHPTKDEINACVEWAKNLGD